MCVHIASPKKNGKFKTDPSDPQIKLVKQPRVILFLIIFKMFPSSSQKSNFYDNIFSSYFHSCYCSYTVIVSVLLLFNYNSNLISARARMTDN